MAIVWNTQDGRKLATLALPSYLGYATAAAFSRGGDQVLLGMTDGVVLLWRFSTGESRVLRGHASNQNVHCVAVSPTNDRAADAGQDFKVIIWDLDRGARIRELDASQATPIALAFSPDGKQIAANGGCAYGGRAYGAILWNAVSGMKDLGIGESSEDVSEIAFSAAGTEIATGSGDGRTITIWDRKSGSKLRTLRPTGELVNPSR